MAKKTGKEKTDYPKLISELRENGAGRLYLLWGEEDYLREQFFTELVKQTVGESDDDFNHRRLDGPQIDFARLNEAVNAMPFFSERTLVEVRGMDINKLKSEQSESLKSILNDIPDYCTVAIILATGYEPDGRLSDYKLIRKLGQAIEFTAQAQNRLTGWIVRRFDSFGKKISPRDAEYLVFISGSLMSGLIPEIEKIANYAKGEVVTTRDIDEAAHHLPEAIVFDMTDMISAGRYDRASSILAELLAMKDQHPIAILALIGMQMRKLYAARLSIDEKLGKSFVMEAAGVQDFAAEKLLRSARGFTLEGLGRAVELCAEFDYRMKSGSSDDKAVLKELLARIAVEGGNACDR